MLKRRKRDKLWGQRPDWLKTQKELDREKEAAEAARKSLLQCSTNLALMADKYAELAARLVELQEMLKK